MPVRSVDPISLRVAALFQASQWEPPPNLFKTVAKWASEIYAGHVLALAEGKIERLAAPNTAPQKIKDVLVRYRKTGEAKIRGLGPNKEAIFRSPFPHGDNFFAAHELCDFAIGTKEMWRPGFGKGSIEWSASSPDVEDVLKRFRDWMTGQESMLEPYIQQLTENVRNVSKEDVIEVHRLRRECLKYTDKPKLRANKVKVRVPVDLSGWKYLTEKEERKIVPQWRRRGVDLEMFFKSQSSEFSGLWTYGILHGYSISLVAPSGHRKMTPSPETFHARMQDLLETCWHECQHAGQTFLKQIRELKEDAGLPSRDLRQPGTTPEGKYIKDPSIGLPSKRVEVPHALRDTEFYTNLEDATRSLRRILMRAPPADRPDLFRYYVGLNPSKPADFPGRYTFNYSEKMRLLRNKAPEKWRKAVAEMWKALAPELE